MNTLFNDDDFKKSALCSHCSKCVLVAHKEGQIAVRDSKDSEKKTLLFNHDEWQTFIAGVKRGEFDFIASDKTFS
jgi:hypothetical protein